MAHERTSTDSGDMHDPNRFVGAQVGDYEQALSVIRAGQKRSHLMWYIFPRFARVRGTVCVCRTRRIGIRIPA